jgi:hypothetical protein
VNGHRVGVTTRDLGLVGLVERLERVRVALPTSPHVVRRDGTQPRKRVDERRSRT